MGLSIGITVCFVIMLYVQDELSYDRFNVKADRIYRIAFKATINGGKINESNVMPPVAGALQRDFPDVEEATRLHQSGKPKITYKNRSFKDDQVALADSNFFSVFTIPFIKGDAKTALIEPNSIVITKDAARKYFGNEEPLGKLLTVNN